VRSNGHDRLQYGWITCVDELPGHIGPYEVRDRLGQGGMGVVYLGFDPMLDRPVAIKVLKVPDEETRRRFLREARLAAKVHHPHIVSIYAVGEHEGNPYLAMEFIAGRTMAQIIRGGEQVPLARKVHWLSELCAGLNHAHESGIVHRDVKPSNLLIAQSSGALRLVDFGIAHGNEASGMTMVGMIVGTPQYMSPEQITGQPVDARSDIFSVGTVAYELLTGRQAFGGDNLFNVSRQIVSEQPRPIESFVPDVPQALVKAVAKCLQKDPGSRAATAKVLEREFLSIARRLDPEHTLVVAPAEATVVVAPAKDATTSRSEMLREAGEAIEQGQLTTASGLLQRLESGTSPNVDVQLLRQKLQGRRLELRVHEVLAKAEDASQTGSVEEAEAAINALADIAPRHAALERLRHAHQERLDERQVASLTSRARQALHQDRLDEAEALIAEALALAPDAPDALAVQQKLSDRTRAQRIARLVAQASRALDQEDQTGAQKAIDALTKVDPAHRDVARLQARLAAMVTEAADQASPSAAVPAAAAPVAEPATEAAGTPAAASPGAARPGAALLPTPAARPAPQASGPATPLAAPPTPPPAAPAPTGAIAKAATPQAAPKAAPAPVVTVPAADGLVLRPPADAGRSPAPHRDTPEPAATTEGRPGRSMLVPALAVIALLVASGGAYYQFVLAPRAGDTAATGTEPNASGTTGAPAPDAPTSGSPSDLAAGGPAGAPPPAATGPAAGATSATDATTPGKPEDALAVVRQQASSGRYDRAIAAIDQVQGLSAAQLQEERTRIVSAARQYTLAAQRGADDLRVTSSPQYVLGMSMQAQAERDRAAGKPKSAVAGYMEARGHFLQAINDTGRPAAAVVPPAPEPVAPSTPPPAPAAPAQPAIDLSTWSNEEARATIAQFCGAYLGRDLGGLNRIWPNMDPAWRTEFREAFATEGELVCVFESVTLVRATDEFNATARLLTQLPGAEQRRRSLAMTLVPARDRLIIGNIRVR
jgi:serine/threonine-protein kinase